MELWKYEFQKQHLSMSGEKFTQRNIDEQGLDESSMSLIEENKDYWLVRYDEGMHEVLNVVFKDGSTMISIETGR